MSEDIKNTEKGGISVEIEHIFPIIKKWLYSEKEIFLREIVSNACDAVTKLKRLASLGEAKDLDGEDYKITITLDKAARTLTVSDNGIGMTEDEVRRYICQIALSGALEFVQKYEGNDVDTSKDGIIGHFGLGFYSSFMVSNTVDVITRSYTSDKAVKWVCTEAGEYEITPDCFRAERGTDVIMHIMPEEEEFLDEFRIRGILDKYCSFMPVEIYLDVVKTEEEKAEEKKDDKDEAKEPEAPKPINDIHPLWQKNPSECTDEEYDSFYHKVFNDYREPLFHIHLNADYPLNFKGILYFPRLAHEYDSLEGQVKLYYNQVFVADNIKEVIPEFLLMLKGVLDCPELPLNVSRSYLQNSGYVAKISAHIVKKVADKLNSMFNTERENYEKLWNDLKTFVEYGCLRDHKFYERVKDSVLYQNTDGKYKTLNEYLEAAKEKHEKTIYYTADKTAQAQYISMFAAEGIEVVVLDKLIDNQFINVIEQENEGVKFVRIDADVAGALKAEGKAEENTKLADLFKEVSGNKDLKVSFELLKNEKIPAVLNISEQSRRMDDMMKMYRMSGNDTGDFNFPTDATLVVNASSPLIKRLADAVEESEDKSKKIAKQIYTLALLAQRQLTADELQSFLADSFDMLENI
ncbi:MAG: molecular chaperone HtpG [Clostridiales bacterium]|nr:molecular chaperone HtpG [Clostridiales bacterium]